MKNIHNQAPIARAAKKNTTENEPIGIVISRGTRVEPVPMFSAYIWCSVPGTEISSSAKAA